MSSNSDNPAPMTCAEFEASFDQYVDDLLDIAMTEACSCHIGKCPPCDREVTRWQQTRILLSTAVTDFATAVDVSSVRDDVFAALGFSDEGPAERRRSTMREAAVDRGREAGRSPARKAGRKAADSPRRSGFAGVLRFASAATVSALTAAAAVLVLTPDPQPQMTARVSERTTEQSPIRVSNKPGRIAGLRNNGLGDIAPVSYSPPPLARPQVSHVDGIEAAPGQAVSTWVQPRTNARVIWVQDRGMGAPVRTAGLSR